MANFRANFERELKQKLEQKAKNAQNVEVTLLKTFKYFDLNGNGTIGKDEFLKTIEKIGIQIFNQ